jgi:hypothetical protein
MKQRINLPASLDEQRAWLQNREKLAEMPMDDVLDLATRVTDKLAEQGLTAFERKAFEEAAELFDELATVWRNASEVLPEDMIPFLKMVIDYWGERGVAAQQEKTMGEREAASGSESSETGSRITLVSQLSRSSELEKSSGIRLIRPRKGFANKNSRLSQRNKMSDRLRGKSDSGRWETK